MTERATTTISDAEALDGIAALLQDPEWGVGMLEDINEWVTSTGRSTAETCYSCGHAASFGGPDETCSADSGCGCVDHAPQQTWDRH